MSTTVCERGGSAYDLKMAWPTMILGPWAKRSGALSAGRIRGPRCQNRK